MRLSAQVQGVQSLQGLQLPQGQGQAQQLTLAPVQTLPLGQTGQVSLPNLQTVTVNSVSQGIQYTGDDAKSPVGTCLPASPRAFTPLARPRTNPLLPPALQVFRSKRSRTLKSGS